ncbi:hypothetical protein L2E82_05850 [Cichorium intybus]|uniref:Uncharacterized protein n=1 Tax=Cichorium intybus TaxID=13427 RepID=A0ACB9HAL4_CICIN|nr:hypothetical protein L2E82_05850 [Cichorium intybus]
MDGRRITASPRPCNGRRVVAKKRPCGGVDGFVNSVKKLQWREICSKRDRSFSMCDAQERFKNIRLQIVVARDIVFALAQSGICAAFSRGIIKNKNLKLFKIVEILPG